MNLIVMILVGLVAGFAASKVMKTKTSLITEIILGIAGAILGGWITSLITGINMVGGFNLTSLIVAFLGSVLVIFIYRFIKRRK